MCTAFHFIWGNFWWERARISSGGPVIPPDHFLGFTTDFIVFQDYSFSPNIKYNKQQKTKNPKPE